MKFRRIQFKNHPILGNCSFDFTDKNGNTLDTIIIAGENGCGKSVLLNELFEYKPNKINNNKAGQIISEIELDEIELSILNRYEYFTESIPEGIQTNILKFIQNFDIKNSWEQAQVQINGKSYPGYVTSAKNLYKRIYSDVEINFTPKQIQSISAYNIDQADNTNDIKSTVDLATEITQLLIDIKSLDDSELSDWVNGHPGQVPPEDVKSIRMKRFTNAFHLIFNNKRFRGINNEEGRKIVLFEEFGRAIPIEKLSSGEKQIVFRGSFLLKDKKSIEGAYVLVDEPEISLHPKWQLEILPFIKKLFTNEQGVQTSQIIIATHSPFIIHNSNRNNDKVIILQKDDKGQISVSDKPEYYSWTSNRLVEDAFNVNIDLQPNITNVFLEGETDELYYNKAIEVYDFDRSSIRFSWIGRNPQKGQAENTGDKALNHAALFFKSNPHIIKSNIVLLYDCDTNKPEEDIEKLHIRRMQNNGSNSQYKIGVENLLNLPNDFNGEQFYTLTTKLDDYGAKSDIRTLDKTKLCEYICKLPNEQLIEIFANIKNEIEKINAIK